MKIKNYILLGLLSLTLVGGACQPPSTSVATNGNKTADGNRVSETAQ
ncbi:MAG: hypothetical protein H0W58_14760 [Acidobacteria bacterium]|nr:hypothetical protein [Acidobacteriota bacterium]